MRLFIILLLFYSPVFATTWYAKPTATGTGDGKSWANALTSIQAVNDSIQAGDTCYLNGTFIGTTLIGKGGTFSNRTAYLAGDGVNANTLSIGSATIQQGDTLTGWVVHSGSVYKTSYSGIPGTGDLAGVWFNDTSALFYVTSLADVDGTCNAGVLCYNDGSDGEFYYDGSTQTVYAYFPGGSSPTGNTIIAHRYQSDISITGNNSYISIVGLRIKFASQGIAQGEAGLLLPDSIFVERCIISNIAEHTGSNPSGWLIGATAGGTGLDDHSRFCRMRACTVSYVSENMSSNGHGSGNTWYSCDTCTIDSNYYYGRFTGYAINLKGRGDTLFDSHAGNTIAFNHIDGIQGRGGISIWTQWEYNWVYGNVVDAHVLEAIEIGHGFPDKSNATSTGHNRVFNNTFVVRDSKYDIGQMGGLAVNQENGAGGPNEQFAGIDNQVKYNIFYIGHSPIAPHQYAFNHRDTTGFVIPGWPNGDSLHWVIDSNMYYYDWTGIPLTAVGGTDYDTTTWRSRWGWDAASTFDVNPGFADTVNGDFSRPSASGEMSNLYGGKSWTIYGAIQPGDTVLPPPPPSGDTIPPAKIDSTAHNFGGQIGSVDGTVDLFWIAPGDDGDSGTATAYQIRYSLQPITASTWPGDNLVPFVPSPLPAGSQEQFTVTGLEAGGQYYFAIKARDEANNWSPLSDVIRVYATGLKVPALAGVVIDSLAATATVACNPVTSYLDPISYEFQLDVTDSFLVPRSQVIGTVIGGRAEATFDSLLSDPAGYYWRCRAIHTLSGTTSQWANAWFNLAGDTNTAPSAPIVLQPQDGGTVTSLQPTLWVLNGVDPDGDPLGYTFELFDANNQRLLPGVDLDEQPDSTGWTVPDGLLANDNVYRWRARCWDGLASSPWTPTVSFTPFSLATSGQAVKAYNSPVSVSFIRGQTTTFYLPDTPVDLTIITVSGQEVLHKSGLTGQWTWDGRNASGNQVAIGTYLWYVPGTVFSGHVVVTP